MMISNLINTLVSIYCLLQALAEGHFNYQMKILEHPSDETVTKGESVRMKCRAVYPELVEWGIYTPLDGHYLYPVWRWGEIPRRKSHSPRNSRFTWDWNSNDFHNFDLIINDVTKSDEGIYYCNIHGPGNWEAKSRYAVLTVVYSDDPMFLKAPENIYAVVGKDVRFKCRITSNATKVFWMFYPEEIGTDGRDIMVASKRNNETGKPALYKQETYSWGLENSTTRNDLIISGVKKSESGMYGCRAMDPFGYRKARLVVIELPNNTHRTLFPKMVFTVQQNHTKRLYCPAPADPEDKIAWFDEDFNVLIYDEVIVTKNPRISVKLEDKTVMEFSQVQSEDGSLYYCLSLTDHVPKLFERQLLVEGCPPSGLDDVDWFEYKTNGKCYGTIKNKRLRFGQAEVTCRILGGYLVMLKAQMIHLSQLRYIFPADLVLFPLWIGLSDFDHDRNWTWSDRTILRPSQAERYPNEPHDSSELDCTMVLEQGGWFAEHCSAEHYFLCETPHINWARRRKIQEKRCPKNWIYFDCGGFCYNRISPTLSWSKANEYCAAHNSTIVMPKTKRETWNVRILLDTIAQPVRPEAWIGLKKDTFGSSYEWTDGIVEQWIRWDHGHNNALHHDCLTIKQNGSINARLCHDYHYVICQRPQEIIRDPILSTPRCGESTLHYEINARTTRSSEATLHTGRVTHGESISIDQVPWTVRLFKDRKFHCGGVLVTPRHVLTAAHCLTTFSHNELTTSKLHVALGSDGADIKGGTLEDVHSITISKAYMGPSLLGFDIGVIELKRKTHTDCWNTRTVCLPDPTPGDLDLPFTGYDCLLAGWGSGSGDSLKFCNIREYNFPNLLSIFPIRFSINASTDTCRGSSGDSGSPMVCRKRSLDRWYVVGIHTGGMKDNTRKFYMSPVLYYIWINETIQRK